MLDIKFIKENREAVERSIAKKGLSLDLADLLVLNEKRLNLTRAIEEMNRQRNVDKKAFNGKILSQEDRAVAVRRGKEIKAKIFALEKDLLQIQKDYDVFMAMVPNIYSPDTPEGSGENDNVEIFRSSEIPGFNFIPKDHIEIGLGLKILDLKRGIKVSGYRGYYICNEGVSLMLGFMMYALNKMASKGYSTMLVPTIVKGFALFGSGYFKGMEYNSQVDEIYQVSSADKESNGFSDKDRKFLVGTSEPSLLAYYANEILDEDQLPIKVSAFSQCYRSEIGSYGRDTKGIYRVHEFMKVEQVVLMRANIEESVRMQDEMVNISREMHEELKIPYRQLQICTQDMGVGKYRMFDIEAWMPGLNRWGETGSSSNFLDWQARRLNIKYKTFAGKKEYVFMLNNTALPSPRIFIAILENYQQENGSVLIPEIIKPFMPVKYDLIRKK